LQKTRGLSYGSNKMPWMLCLSVHSVQECPFVRTNAKTNGRRKGTSVEVVRKNGGKKSRPNLKNKALTKRMSLRTSVKALALGITRGHQGP